MLRTSSNPPTCGERGRLAARGCSYHLCGDMFEWEALAILQNDREGTHILLYLQNSVSLILGSTEFYQNRPRRD